MKEDNAYDENDEKTGTETHETEIMRTVLEKMKDSMDVEVLDDETTRMTKRLVVIRISTKHINLWMRKLEVRRKEMIELAGLMGFDDVKEEIQKEKSLERWARGAHTT